MEPRNSEGSAGDMGDVAGRSCLGLFQQEMERWSWDSTGAESVKIRLIFSVVQLINVKDYSTYAEEWVLRGYYICTGLRGLITYVLGTGCWWVEVNEILIHISRRKGLTYMSWVLNNTYAWELSTEDIIQAEDWKLSGYHLCTEEWVLRS